VPGAGLEEVDRIVPGLGLGVLTEGEAHRAAVRRVGHHPQRAGQGGQDLLGPADPVEVAHDRAETVVGADGGIVEILDLLQHRVKRSDYNFDKNAIGPIGDEAIIIIDCEGMSK